MSNRGLIILGFVLYFMGGSVFASELLCDDADAPTYVNIRESTQGHQFSGSVQYPLTAQGRALIQQIQETGISTQIYPDHLDNEAICAAYLYEFSQYVRGPTAPSHFGMYHPQDRTVCSARELPYCYRYRGGEVMIDLGDQYGPALKKNPTDFTSLATDLDMLRRYAKAWDYQAYLGDLTFIYSESNYLHMIGVYGNYNSHIAKNLGPQSFDISLADLGTGVSNQLMMREALGCTQDMRTLLEPVWKHLPLSLNDTPMRYVGDDIVMQYTNNERKETVLQPGDVITYDDIMMIHFREGEKTQSLFEFICKEQFYPIAVVSIGEQWVGKE